MQRTVSCRAHHPQCVPWSEPRFSCDDHLRKLARWLRAAGLDVSWEKDIEDRVLLARAAREGRVVLTRDRGLRSGPGVAVHHLGSPDPRAQLEEVVRRHHLDLETKAFTRCPVCNVLLEPCRAEDAPPKARAACDVFRRCPTCGRTYWEGTHVKRLRRLFQAATNAARA